VTEYLSYDEAHIYTGLAIITLKRAVYKRQLAHIKKGRRVLFRRPDLDKWMSISLVKEVA